MNCVPGTSVTTESKVCVQTLPAILAVVMGYKLIPLLLRPNNFSLEPDEERQLQ